MRTYEESLIYNAENQIRRAALAGLEIIFTDEFSAAPGGLMAPLFAGLVELIKRGMFDRARVLVDSVTTPPPEITEERMSAVKDQIKALFPQ
jgi:hypothetical protein